jgi:hypothetical protein
LLACAFHSMARINVGKKIPWGLFSHIAKDTRCDMTRRISSRTFDTKDVDDSEHQINSESFPSVQLYLCFDKKCQCQPFAIELDANKISKLPHRSATTTFRNMFVATSADEGILTGNHLSEWFSETTVSFRITTRTRTIARTTTRTTTAYHGTQNHGTIPTGISRVRILPTPTSPASTVSTIQPISSSGTTRFVTVEFGRASTWTLALENWTSGKRPASLWYGRACACACVSRFGRGVRAACLLGFESARLMMVHRIFGCGESIW